MAIITEILKHWFQNTTLQYFSSDVRINNNYIAINKKKRKEKSINQKQLFFTFRQSITEKKKLVAQMKSWCHG